MLKPTKTHNHSFASIAPKLKVAIIKSEFNSAITNRLERHCLKTLKQHGVKGGNIATFTVPGALEIPIVAKRIAKNQKHDAIITLGCVIKGETYHFELVANECARGCATVALEYEIPVIFEVMATYTLKQAQARSANNDSNKGIEAAISTLKTCFTLSKIKEAK